MANKILRAGPFGQYNDSFRDEPSPAVPYITPINAVLEDHEKWNWKYYYGVYEESSEQGIITDTKEYKRAIQGSEITPVPPYMIDEDESFSLTSGNDDANLENRIYWRYQSTADITADIDYDIRSNGTGGNGGAFVSITITVDGVKVEGNDPTNIYGVTYYNGDPLDAGGYYNASLDGTITVDLPNTDRDLPKLVEIVCTTQNTTASASTATGSISIQLINPLAT